MGPPLWERKLFLAELFMSDAGVTTGIVCKKVMFDAPGSAVSGTYSTSMGSVLAALDASPQFGADTTKYVAGELVGLNMIRTSYYPEIQHNTNAAGAQIAVTDNQVDLFSESIPLKDQKYLVVQRILGICPNHSRVKFLVDSRPSPRPSSRPPSANPLLASSSAKRRRHLGVAPRTHAGRPGLVVCTGGRPGLVVPSSSSAGGRRRDPPRLHQRRTVKPGFFFRSLPANPPGTNPPKTKGR